MTVAIGSTGLGQGLETVMSQIAADALALPIERIRLLHGSTTLVEQGFGSFHSRATVLGGSAILLAAEALLELIRKEAAARLACEPGQIAISDGGACFVGKRLDLAEFAGLSVERQFENKKLTYSYGAHAAHVAVDPGTGFVEILDYLTVEDVGRVINPATLHGQVLGAVVQGLGSTFLEHLQYDENGQLLTGSLADYLLPTLDRLIRASVRSRSGFVRARTIRSAPRAPARAGSLPSAASSAMRLPQPCALSPSSRAICPCRRREFGS